MTNHLKAKAILGCRDCENKDVSVHHRMSCTRCVKFSSVTKMAEWKDKQPITDLGGWVSPVHDPIRNCFCLVKLKTSYPKNCKYVVAEFDADAKCFYFESDDEPIDIKDVEKWKLLQVINDIEQC